MTKEELAMKVMEAGRDASPPVAVTGLHFMGVNLPDIVSIVTLVYLFVQIGYLINKWWRGSNDR